MTASKQTHTLYAGGQRYVQTCACHSANVTQTSAKPDVFRCACGEPYARSSDAEWLADSVELTPPSRKHEHEQAHKMVASLQIERDGSADRAARRRSYLPPGGALMQTVVVRTAKLSNGLCVLARDSGPYAGTPKTFANLTQAKRWVDALAQSGQEASIYRLGRPFYVVLRGEGQS